MTASISNTLWKPRPKVLVIVASLLQPDFCSLRRLQNRCADTIEGVAKSRRFAG
jgi:hypothetical protein